MIITFIGHSSLQISENLQNNIKKAIVKNINQTAKTLFYCGGYGDFDNLCAKICRMIKNEFHNCEIVYITPYITESQQKRIKYLLDLKLYDSTIYPPLENIPLKFAINKRNEWMIDNANIIIAHINHSFGGAFKSLKYAQKKKKHIIMV